MIIMTTFLLTQVTFHIIDSNGVRWIVDYVPAGDHWHATVTKNLTTVLHNFKTINVPSYDAARGIIFYVQSGREADNQN